MLIVIIVVIISIVIISVIIISYFIVSDFTMATDAVAPPTAEGVESKDEKMSPEEKDKKTKEFVEYMRNAPGMAKIKPEYDKLK